MLTKNQKHAYLIMAHGNVKQLKILLSVLDDVRNNIFIHWDKKSEELDETFLLSDIKYSRVYIVPSMSVSWAGYTQVLCQLNLWEFAAKTQEHAYYHLISGVDLPIKTQDEIHEYFNAQDNKQFIHFVEHSYDYYERIQYYYFFQDLYGRNYKRLIYIGFYLFDMVSVRLQKLLKLNRLSGESVKIYKGTNWCSITHELVTYILSQRDWIEKTCKYGRYSDEVFVHTLVKNSRFANQVYTPLNEKPADMALRKIDWDRGLPYTYKTEDYDMLVNTGCLFARKFSADVDINIIEKIVNKIANT